MYDLCGVFQALSMSTCFYFMLVITHQSTTYIRLNIMYPPKIYWPGVDFKVLLQGYLIAHAKYERIFPHRSRKVRTLVGSFLQNLEIGQKSKNIKILLRR